MLTPQEIQDKKFEKARFGGYDMTQIDDFLDVVLADYTSLYKENATLKGKMRVLVDKIEEYRAVDEQMRKALYSAQVSARDIVAKAQSEADAILKNANATAQAQIGDLRGQIELEEKRLAASKEACSDYAQRISAMLRKNIEVIEQLIEAPAEKLTSPQPANVDAAAYAASIHRAAEQKTADGLAQSHADDTIRYTQPQSAENAAPQPDSRPAIPIEPEHVVHRDDMETQYYSFDIGDDSADEPRRRRGGKKNKEEESDTAKIFGDSIFTPKPRMDFNVNNLEFGPNYHQDIDKE